MMYQDPMVSIIMPAYNAQHTIVLAINSVISQTYSDWELVVVDDGSNDDTPDIVASFMLKESRVLLYKLGKNGGLAKARNEGCRKARGRFITFLDSDDLWKPEKLDRQIRYHLDNSNIDISHTGFVFFNGTEIIHRPLSNFFNWTKKEGFLYPSICYRNSIGVLTVMVKKEVLIDVNFFDESLWTMEDQDLWIRIARRNYMFGYISEVLACYRITSGGISSKIARYKKAYKDFIKKLSSSDRSLNNREIWRVYYRYFGAIYFSKQKFTLSQLYFLKSVKVRPFSFNNVGTIAYLTYSLIKGITASLGGTR